MAQMITVENVLEAFDLLIQLGSGSKGQVWLARHPGHPSGLVAVKLLTPSFRSDFSAGGERWEVLGDHPNIVRVIEANWGGAHPFVAMEYVDGPSLRVVLEMSRSQYIPLPVTMHIMRGVLHALAFAHTRANAEAVVHGALSPDSVLIDSGTGTAKLDDFGLGPTDGPPDTVRGRVMDCLRHLAPEQLAGKAATVETDLYAAGILLHELLFGVGPFEHLPMLSLLSPLTRARSFTVSDLPQGTPVGLLGVLRRALAGSRDERFASAREMLAAIQSYMPPWEEGARMVSRFARQLARHAHDALDSVDTQAPMQSFESVWEPRIAGGDSEPTDPMAAVTAVSWTSTYQLAAATTAAEESQNSANSPEAKH